MDLTEAPCLLCIGNNLHLIGGWSANKHIIYDLDTAKHEVIYDFPNISSMYGTVAIYSKSKQSILMMGSAIGENDDKLGLECIP